MCLTLVLLVRDPYLAFEQELSIKVPKTTRLKIDLFNFVYSGAGAVG